ncbi:MAG: hypothetical protein US31_C0001G0014 [Berkelbacteria bacterium GW2011_GWA1_36_9]|uniref:HicB-like antitoxin of toxin-antitoxin system domain-containing protein n=1 Tax=Berkelbacteria bacterium GW2011_GWA1_36_9 TaxID=1618331 RepID=A0A0G0FLX9_9BACT|nr:MAG: hypothetical protein US31_C0001G0014 [Berkelbacteria bacterium GW2011_GWA1_36_9]
MRNSYKKGNITVFVYPENSKFIGVCLELDIVEEGNNLEQVKNILSDAVKTHVEIVIKNKLSKNLLNRPAPKEYWDRFFSYLATIKQMKKNVMQQEVQPTLVSTIPFGSLTPC